MGTMLHSILLPVVDLRHPPHASASQSRVLVAVPPAIHRALNQTAFASEARVQLRECPADCIAFAFVMQPIALVLVFWTASAGIHAVFGLELLGQLVHVDRLDIASNRVFHLDTVPRVFESDPLDPVLVLSNYEWRGRVNRTRGSIGVHCRTRCRTVMDTLSTSGRARRSSSGGAHSSTLALDLGLGPRARASCERRSNRVRRVLRERLPRLLRNEVCVQGARLLHVRLPILLGRYRVRRVRVHWLLIHRSGVMFLVRRLNRGWRCRLWSCVHWWISCTIHGCSGHSGRIHVFSRRITLDVVVVEGPGTGVIRAFLRRLTATRTRKAAHVR